MLINEIKKNDGPLLLTGAFLVSSLLQPHNSMSTVTWVSYWWWQSGLCNHIGICQILYVLLHIKVSYLSRVASFVNEDLLIFVSFLVMKVEFLLLFISSENEDEQFELVPLRAKSSMWSLIRKE